MAENLSRLILPSVTATPSGVGDGDTWFRTDIDTVIVRAGGVLTETRLPANCFPFSGGVTHVCPRQGSTAAGTPSAGDMSLIPMALSRSGTIHQLFFEITTQGVSASGTDVIRFGVYNSDDTTMRPTGAAVVDFGTSDLEATVGVKTFNVTNTALGPRLYWFAIVRQTTGSISTAAQVRRQSPSHECYKYLSEITVPAIGSTGGLGTSYVQTGVTGALPTIGTLTYDTGNPPSVLVEWA